MVRWMSRCWLWGAVMLGLSGCGDPIIVLDVDGVPAGTQSLLLRTRLGGKLGTEAWFPGDRRRLAVQLPGGADSRVALDLYAMKPGDCVTASVHLEEEVPGGPGRWTERAVALAGRSEDRCSLEARVLTLMPSSLTPINMQGVWVSESNDVYAAGGGSAVVRCLSGQACSNLSLELPPQNPGFDLNAVWGSSNASVYLAGSGGLLVNCQGAACRQIRISAVTDYTKSLRSMWGISGKSAYAVGDGGAFVICDVPTGACTFRDVVPSRPLRGIWGLDERRIFVVGDGGTLLRCHSDGACTPEGLSKTETLNAVWGSDASHVYAVGGKGTVWRCTDQPGSCRLLDSGTMSELRSVWGTDAGNVYAVGSQGTILRCSDGTDSCTVLDSGTTQHLLAVRSSDAGTAYVVGEVGTVLRCSAGAASCSPLAVPGGTRQHLRAVFGTNPDNLYFVGDANTILRRKLP